jgi:hypothetical protein
LIYYIDGFLRESQVSFQHFTESRVNNASYTRPVDIPQTTDSSGDTATLPTITENKVHSIFRCDLSEASQTSLSSSEMPYNGKKKFQVTHIMDPIPPTMNPSGNAESTLPAITENKNHH